MIQAPTRPPTTPESPMQPVYEITEADKKRQEAIANAWKAYNGELDKPLKKMPDQPDDNVLSNRCQPIVDAGVNFLFGKEVELAIEEHAPQEAQDLLEKTWGRKERRLPLLQDLAMNGAMAGSAFLRIVPGPNMTFRLVVVDPAIVVGVKTAPQDIETVLLYCIEYCTDEKINGKPSRVYYREEITRIDPDADDTQLYEDINAGIDEDVTWQIQHWTQIVPGMMQPKPGNWTPAGDPLTWPYPFAPLFSCKNLPMPNSFWGKADITPDLIGVNGALNLLLSSINRVEKIYGMPLIFAPGTGEQVLTIEPGKIIQLPLFENKLESVHIHTDVNNALTFAADLRSDMDEQSHVPGVATGRMRDLPRGQLSGIALELLFMPLLKKTDKKRCLYGELIIEVSKALFVLARLSGDIDMEISWQSPMPSIDLQSVQALIAKMQIGISKTTIQREAGYDPEEELKLSQAENEQAAADFAAQQLPMPAPQSGQAQPGQQPQASPFIGRQQ